MTPTAAVLAALSQHGLLLKQDKQLPNVVTILTGEKLSTSWWSHPKGKLIFNVLRELEDHPDVLVAKLIAGKDTLIHRRLWPAFLAATSRLLVHTREVHTESGRHELVTQSWRAWAKEKGVAPLASAQEGRRIIEEACSAIGASPATLPWNARPASRASRARSPRALRRRPRTAAARSLRRR